MVFKTPVQSLRYPIVLDSHTFSIAEAIRKNDFCRYWIYELWKSYRKKKYKRRIYWSLNSKTGQNLA
ncbi:MAG: hypothetical protein ACFFD4_08680 [Candidatus Odinarchaeota archaeon]